MPTRNRLKEIATVLNQDPDEMVLKALHEAGSRLGAALRIGVAPNTIRWWMDKHGYTLVDGELHKLSDQQEQAS